MKPSEYRVRYMGPGVYEVIDIASELVMATTPYAFLAQDIKAALDKRELDTPVLELTDL